MRNVWGGLLVAAVAAFAWPAVAQQPGAAAEPPAKWGASIDLEGKPGTDRHLGEADLLLPVFQDADTLLFASLRARFDDNDSKEGNFGLGLRQMHASGWNGGLYGYFDRRRSEYDNLFNQLTFGAEALGEDFDLRVNSYWPIGRKVKVVDSLNTADVSGTSVIFRGGEEHALQGFDAEVGWRAPAFAAEGPLDLRVYAGGYTFDDDTVDAVTGPRLRAELTAYEVPGLWDGARITLGAEWQHDEPRGGQGFVSARLRIPLQPKTERGRRLTAQERRMTAPIVRDVDIVAQAGTFGPPETATQTANGGTLTVLSSASTTGANLPAAVAAAGNNSTVVLSGRFDTGVNTTTLQTGQTLMGGGSVAVRSPSGRTARLTTPGATITGAAALADGTITMGTDSTLIGMTINDSEAGANAIAIRVNGVNGSRILDNTVTATQTAGGGVAHGLHIVNASNTTVSGNSITASNSSSNSAYALYMNNSTGLTVTGNTLNGAGGAGRRYMRVQDVTINAGSTGNTATAGVCETAGANTGFVGFGNAANCGP